MLKIENISYRIGGKTIFENSTVTIPPGHKVGVVGRNGIGKSTLFFNHSARFIKMSH